MRRKQAVKQYKNADDFYIDAKWVLTRRGKPIIFQQHMSHVAVYDGLNADPLAGGVIERGRVSIYFFDEGRTNENMVRQVIAAAWVSWKEENL